MAIDTSDIEFYPLNSSSPAVSGSANNLFRDARVGDPTDYALVEVRNTCPTGLTYSTPVAWLSAASGGADVAIAVADPTARDIGYGYPFIDPSTLSYAAPSSAPTGISLPTLAAGQKCLLAIRRTLSGASVAKPETNVLRVSGTSPI